jgi:hypothetical protein
MYPDPVPEVGPEAGFEQRSPLESWPCLKPALSKRGCLFGCLALVNILEKLKAHDFGAMPPTVLLPPAQGYTHNVNFQCDSRHLFWL